MGCKEATQDTKKKTFRGFILTAVSQKDSDRWEQVLKEKMNKIK